MTGLISILLYYYNHGNPNVFRHIREIYFFIDGFRIASDVNSLEYTILMEFMEFMENKYVRKPEAMSIYTYLEKRQKDNIDGVYKFYKLLFEFLDLKGIDYSEYKKRKKH
ncbi:MAG TPA: hypothetical protein PK006_13635 [Saprospiraceae bacterium]|nr:hypothetical protein [Saprospiraceae bacterium]